MCAPQSGPATEPFLRRKGTCSTCASPRTSTRHGSAGSTELLRPDGLYGTKTVTGGNKAAKLKATRAALETADRVWLATDCDREGQLIGQEILEHCRYRGAVMRVLFTAQDPETIRMAFRRARPNEEHGRLYNLSLARTATVTLGRGAEGVIGIGRVRTPTLAIACRREIEIREFVPVGYFEMVETEHAEGGAFRILGNDREKRLCGFQSQHAYRCC